MLAGVWLIYFCFGLTTASLAPLVPLLREEFGIGNAAMGLILGAWPLVYIAAALPCGVLLDRIGTRRGLFLAGLVIALSGVLRSVADGPGMLLFAVAVFGIGGPLISVGAPKLVAGLFQGPDRGTAMGIYMTGPYLGGIASLSLTHSLLLPLAGGDWRKVTLMLAGVAAVSALAWVTVLGRAPAGAGRLAGEGKKFHLGAFVELLRHPEVRLILAMSVGIFFINHALNNWLPVVLMAKGLDAAEAGLWSALPSVVGVVGALILPRLATPRWRYRIMAALFAMAFLASLLLQGAAGPGMVAALVMQGIARSAMMTIAMLFLMETPGVPAERLGLAGGLFFTMAEIGGVLGPVVFGAISETPLGFGPPLAVISVICLGLMTALAALVRARRRAGA